MADIRQWLSVTSTVCRHLVKVACNPVPQCYGADAVTRLLSARYKSKLITVSSTCAGKTKDGTPAQRSPRLE